MRLGVLWLRIYFRALVGEKHGMAHSIGLLVRKEIEVINSDIVIVVRKDGERLGTLTLSKGTIDWRPKSARRGKQRETSLDWTQFARAMRDAK
jgi:hypothetical protein